MAAPLLALLLTMPQAPDPLADQLPTGLPPALRRADDSPVASADAWAARRLEIRELFESHVYGRVAVPLPTAHEVLDTATVMDGAARRQRVRVIFGTGEQTVTSELLVYRPAKALDAPLFLGLNFRGNHTIDPDQGIPVPAAPAGAPSGLARPAPESERGERARRYPVARLIERGYGFATAWYGDLDPDFDDGFQNGLHPLFGDIVEPRPADAPGAITIWAHGLSAFRRVLADLGTGRVAVFGHSRLGKTSLWAGAIDPEFAMVISNDSGCGGAALSMRRHGETVEAITRRFPHWFCPRFADYAGREEKLPVDQHLLIALIAPRPVYVASATGDDWADPLGEFLAAREAGPVYELLGRQGLGSREQPAPDTSIGDHIGYHLRSGKHDLTAADWEHYLDFADRHLPR